MTITVAQTHAAQPNAGAGRAPRVALYSHDAVGLGHIRRNLAIARALSVAGMRPDILLLTSAPGAVVFDRPEGCDLVALPAVCKDVTGAYGPRHLSIASAHLRRMRESILLASLEAFAPDVLIVDKHARGLDGELEKALTLLSARGTRIVLGVRDVLDDARTSALEWERDRTKAALARWYDDVWVYGDREVHDPLARLDVPARLRGRVRHTGYLARGRATDEPEASVPDPYVLAMVGGGSDGAALARAFARAALPEGHTGLLVTGPQMPEGDRAEIERIAATRDDLVVRTYVEGAAQIVARAAAVVGMGGYNTVCEAMAAGTPMLVVPRVVPRREQLVRARALEQRAAVDCLEPDELSAEAIAQWLRVAVRRTRRTTTGVDLDGLSRIPVLFRDLADRAAPAKETR